MTIKQAAAPSHIQAIFQPVRAFAAEPPAMAAKAIQTQPAMTSPSAQFNATLQGARRKMAIAAATNNIPNQPRAQIKWPPNAADASPGTNGPAASRARARHTATGPLSQRPETSLPHDGAEPSRPDAVLGVLGVLLGAGPGLLRDAFSLRDFFFAFTAPRSLVFAALPTLIDGSTIG